MKRKTILTLITLLLIAVTLLSGCSELLSEITSEGDLQQSETETTTQPEQTDEVPTEETQIEFDTDQKIFLEISIDTKEDELQAISDRYGYHLSYTEYNTDTRSRDKNYVYELYDPSQFKSETEENFRYNRSYSHVEVTYYHANDDVDTQYIVSCKYNFTRGGEDLLVQSYDVNTGTTEYSYWKKVTSASAHQDENWHPASSAEEALIAYLTD